MSSLVLASGTSIIADTATLTGYVVSIAGGVSLVGGFALTSLRRRRRARAQLLKTGWQGAPSAGGSGALVYNESSVDFKDIVLTVACAHTAREARQDVGLLRAKTERHWPAQELHETMVSGIVPPPGASGDTAHLAAPHEVNATFTDGKSYWYRTSERAVKLRELTMWAEATRAETLRRYFGRRSVFQHDFAVRVHIESFERTEHLEAAFTALGTTHHAPPGVRLPDIVVGPHDWIGRVVTDASIVEPPPSLSRLHAVDPKAVAALSRHGRLYGVPYVFDSVALIQNDALVDGPPHGNLGDVLAAGREAIERHRIEAGVPLALQVGAPDGAGNAGDPYHFWPLFTSLGGSFFGLRDSATARFDDPGDWREGFVDAFHDLARLGVAGGGPLDPDTGRDRSLDLFLAGRAPYLVSSSRALRSIKERGMKVTVGPVPSLGAQPAVPMVSVYGFFIYRGAPNLPAARDLLTTYMQRSSAGLDLQRIQQLVPVQIDAMTAVAAADPQLAGYVAQCRDGMIMPSYPEMRDAWRLLGQTEYDVLAGNGDPRDRAAQAADAGWEMLAGARA